MKKKTKRISILMLLIVLTNFFITIYAPIVNALESGNVYNKFVTTKTNIADVNSKIVTSKENSLYETDKSYFESINYIKENLQTLEELLIKNEEKLDKKIELSSLIMTNFLEKQTLYETYFASSNTLIDVNDIKDITYIYYEEDDLLKEFPKTKTLLTKEEIEQALINFYLKEIDDKVTNYNTNYDTIVTSLQEQYNDFISLITTYQTTLDNKKLDIEKFVKEEQALNNNPSMEVNNTNIYALIALARNSLEELKTSATIKNLATSTTNATTIYNEIVTNINTFIENNKNYQEINLDTDITTYQTKILDLNTKIINLFGTIDNYLNNTCTSNPSSLNITYINILKEIINEEDSYNTLTTKINNYLLRKPSDTNTINDLLNDINKKRIYINKEKALEIIKDFVSNSNKNDEDVVDLLRNFLDITCLDNDTKKEITEAKLKFYPLTLNSLTNYTITLKDDYLLVEYLKQTLNKDSFLSNLNYNYNKTLINEEDILTNNSKLNLYDKNNLLIKTYTIIIKGDYDNNNYIDNNDVLLFKEKLLNNSLKEEDKIVLDLNNDNIIDIKDLVILNNLLTNKDIIKTTISNLKIKRSEENNLIYYTIYLETDGLINGLSFNYSASSNLKLVSINDDSYINKESNYFVSLTSLKNNDEVLTICYEEDNSNTEEIFRLFNIKIVYDNNDSKDINDLILKTVKITSKEESSNEVNNAFTSNISNDNESSKEEKVNEIEEKPISKTETEEETKKIEQETLHKNLVKIIIIVLLGAVIIYFLNKKDNEEELFLEEDKNKNDADF